MDYKEIGFRCGIEIHQQLETGKLFCSCPSTADGKSQDIAFSRNLRAVAGETGEIDIAARHETGKGKTFNYIASSGSCCLVEMDEEPPHPVNMEALKTAIEAAKLLNAKIVDEIHIMRKTVIDGSNVSGFQRTALIATGGSIESSMGKVSIPIICLEEEAAQKVEEDEKSATYRLDRLGIPLIELGTGTDIKTPEHAKEVAQKLGLILRSTGKVKRGIGTIRQDVNISIKGGARAEIKGFQELRSIPKVIECEIKRQQAIIRNGKKVEKEVRKAEPDNTTTFLRPMPGAARMYPETDILPVIVSKELFDSIDIPELIEEKARRFGKMGLSKDTAVSIAKSGKSILFDEAVKHYPRLKPAFIADTVFSKLMEAKRKFNVDISSITDRDLMMLLSFINDGKLAKEAVIKALADLSDHSFNIKNYEGVSDSELEKDVKDIVQKNRGAPTGALMGMIMAKFRGKADGKKVMEILKKYS